MDYWATALAASSLAIAATTTPPPSIDATFDQSSALVRAIDGLPGEADQQSNSGEPANERHRRLPADLCIFSDLPSSPQVLREACADGSQGAFTGPTCTPDQITLDPLFRQTRIPGTDQWQTWQALDTGTCLSTADLTTEADNAFRTLPLTPPPLHIQPPDGWTLVNLDTIVHTTPQTDATQTFDLTLLGIPVQLQAHPTTYTWNFGDHTPPLTTTDPGAPYPHHTLTHTYTTPTTTTLTLTTTWTGRFRLHGTTTWTPVTGTATTTTTSDPLTIHEARTHLVTTP